MEGKKEIDVPKIILYFLEFVVVILIIVYLNSLKSSPEPTGIYSEHVQRATITALMNSLDLQNVHDVPLIGLTPRIQIYIKEKDFFVNSYYIEIINNKGIINDGVSNQTDVIIKTTENEITKTITNASYMNESLRFGRTSVIKTTSNFVLYTEGYPDWIIKNK